MVPILASDAIASDEVMSILICHILMRSLIKPLSLTSVASALQ
ncbi:MAG: hypothetical protein V7K50_17785 [Nostoc sp.]